MATLSERAAPYTGFGGVLFGILADDATGSLPEWQSSVVRSTRHVPGSNRAVTQLMGIGPEMVTYRVFCDAREDYRALLALRQTTGTLTVVANGTVAEGDYEAIHGVGYLLIADVTLLDVTNPTFSVDEVVEADCLFIKGAD
jgi:hypothetical protein